jgi:predicted N-acetyltransferase YhbS
MQGTGLGASLFEHMKDQARQRGISAIKIISHPPSVGFYKKMGAIVVGTKAPTPKARWTRPILALSIDKHA